MPTIERDGATLHYEIRGDGPVLVLTHGYSATSRMWNPNVDELSADHTVIVWDVRGHGRSSSPTDPAAYEPDAVVDDLGALLDHVGIDTAVIGGMSLGGYLALRFRLRHPERVAALLLVDTGPGFKRADGRERWNADAHRMADDIERRGRDALAGGGGERRATEHDDLRGLVMAGRHLLPQHDASVIASLPHIDVPTLVVVGADDAPFRAAADYMAAKIPGAELVVIDGAGHAANIDRPRAFNDAVRSFLTAHGV